VVSNDIKEQRRKIKEGQKKLKNKEDNHREELNQEFKEKEKLVTQQFEEQREKENSFFDKNIKEQIEKENSSSGTNIKKVPIEEQLGKQHSDALNIQQQFDHLDDDIGMEIKQETEEDTTTSKKELIQKQSVEKIESLKQSSAKTIQLIKQKLTKDLQTADTDEIEDYATTAQEEIEELENELEGEIEEIEENLEEEIEKIEETNESDDEDNNILDNISEYKSSPFPEIAIGAIGIGVILMVGYVVVSKVTETLSTSPTFAGSNVSTQISNLVPSGSLGFLLFPPLIIIIIMTLFSFTSRRTF